MSIPATGRSRDLSSVLRELWHQNKNADFASLAAGSAFWLLLSVFPAGLIAVNVLGLVVTQEEVADAVGRVAAATPGTWGDLLAEQLRQVAAPTPGSGLYDILLVALGLFTVSNAMVSLLRSLRRVQGLGRPGSVFIRALGTGVAVSVIAVVALVSEVVDFTSSTGSIIGVLITAVILVFLVAGLYRVAGGSAMTVRSLLPGAFIAVVGLLLVGVVLDVYASVSPNMALVYGRIAGIVVSMLTVWLGVYVVLLGAAFNAILVREMDPDPGGPE